MRRILFVDPFGDIAPACAVSLEHDGHQTEWTSGWDGELAHFDLVITTLPAVRLPDSRIVDAPRPPVVLVGDDVVDAKDVQGFRLGADCYLRRPFTSAQFCRLVEAALGHRSGSERISIDPGADVFRCGQVTVDLTTGLAYRDGRAQQLRGRELNVLRALRRRRGGVALRSDLVREVWGGRLDARTRSVDNCIGELRRKIEDDPSAPHHIVAVHGLGYRLLTSADLARGTEVKNSRRSGG